LWLPQTRYILAEWKTAKVQLNYHIQVERMYYSVPYDYICEQVDVRLTTDLIEVYFKEARIASHKRLMGAMAELYKPQNQNKDYQDMDFNDRFNLLVDHEFDRRKSNKLERLIKQANFEDPMAAIEIRIKPFQWLFL